jgi:hypothetical protein
VDPDSANRVVVISVKGVLTFPVADETDVLSAGFVTNIEVVTDGPAPAALDAVTDAVYCVPG